MIKIKDYIFNENEIKWFEKDNEDIKVVFVNDTHIYIRTATLEDIEWNYGQNKIDDEYIGLSNDYQRLLNINEELEEENKKLKETNKNLIFLKDSYYKSINKALEYIKNTMIYDYERKETLNKTYIIDSENYETFIKILKGEE